MKIDTESGLVELVNESMYSLDSADNVRRYPIEHVLGTPRGIASTHGLLVDGEAAMLLAGGGGASGVHDHSALLRDDALFVAVGDGVACVALRPFGLRWFIATDGATCFGLHFDTSRRALISHGELQIARLSLDGRILWSAGGADIFTEGFALAPDAVEAIDFDGRRYRFDYDSGAVLKA